jgi:hypothetical protein
LPFVDKPSARVAQRQGSGGFRYYRLAPSLLEKDKYGNWVINKTVPLPHKVDTKISVEYNIGEGK